MKTYQALLVASGVALLANTALAATSTGTMTSTFVLQPGCFVTSTLGGTSGAANTIPTQSMNLGSAVQGNISVRDLAASAGAGKATSTNYNVNCGNGITYDLTFNAGLYPANAGTGSAADSRRLFRVGGDPGDDNNYLQYHIYRKGTTVDASFTGQTGINDDNIDVFITDLGLGTVKNAGTYSDTVTVTLSYQ